MMGHEFSFSYRGGPVTDDAGTLNGARIPFSIQQPAITLYPGPAHLAALQMHPGGSL